MIGGPYISIFPCYVLGVPCSGLGRGVNAQDKKHKNPFGALRDWPAWAQRHIPRFQRRKITGGVRDRVVWTCSSSNEAIGTDVRGLNCIRSPEHPCQYHNSARVPQHVMTRASMPKP